MRRQRVLLFVYAKANVLGGFMSAYVVVTALTTVRPAFAWIRRLNWGALVVAIALSIIEIGLGLQALASPGDKLGRVPFFMMFVMRVAKVLPEPLLHLQCAPFP